jgi:hypothetical protein
MPSHRIEVCLEVTPKQAFASALEWPGWCRAGRDEGAALEVLARYAGRYAPVAAHAGVSFPATVAFDVAERVPGGPATARSPHPNAAACSRKSPPRPTGRPSPRPQPAAWPACSPRSGRPSTTSPPRHRLSCARAAGWRPGPGPDHRPRDRRRHAYARKLGVKLKQPPLGDTAAIMQLREAIAAELSAPSDGSRFVPGGWDARYAARRIAWHLLEHAWEMQDRADS